MSGAAQPSIAVVVSTYNRARLLPRLVAALEEQQTELSFEVVIVNDASTDDTARVLDALAQAATIPVRVIHQLQNAGPATGRNAGWRASRAPHIAFTDDDCVPQPEWLAELVDGLEVADIVQGRTAPNPDQARSAGPFSRTLDVPAMDGFFQTCNIGFRRSWLEQLAGFDESFRHPAGEDTDLAWRAIEAGAQAAFAEGAVVHHDVRPSSVMASIRDTWRWEGIVLTVRNHPEIRSRLHSRWFWKASHPPALAAAVGLSVAAVSSSRQARAAGLALLLPYAKHRLVDAPLPNIRRRHRLSWLPAAFAVDAAEVAVMAAASGRYRRLLL